MNLEVFARQISDARERAAQLCDRARPVELNTALTETLEELSTAVEELRVAEDELRSQNEALTEAREAAEVQRRRYEDLFNSSPDGYLVTDGQGMILAANLVAARILKARRDYVMGKPLAIFIPDHVRREFRQRIDELMSGRRIDGWSLLTRDREGHDVTNALVNAEPGCDPVDGSSIIRWTLRDVTEVKNLEARIREMDHKLWIRVVERTNSLTLENERLRAEIACLRADMERART